MKDLFLQKGLLSKYKDKLQGYSIKKLFKEFLQLLHVPNVDDCCEAGHNNLPTAYNEDEEQLQYYNPESKEWEEIPTSGSGSGARFGFPGEDDASSENRDFTIGSGMSFNVHSELANTGFFITNNKTLLLSAAREDRLTSIRVFDLYSYALAPPITPPTTSVPDGYRHTVFMSFLDGYSSGAASHGLDFRSDGQLYYYNHIDDSQKSPNSVGYKLIFPVGGTGKIETIARLNDLCKVAINEQLADYFLLPSDFVNPTIVRMSVSSPNIITIDNSILSTVEIGSFVKVAQSGPGNTSFVASGGTNLEVLNSGTKITGRNGLVTITKVDVSTFHICGDIIP